MKALLYLIPIALGLGLTGLIAFFWAMRSGQFDDLDGAAERILHEDESVGTDESNQEPVDSSTNY